MKTTPIKKLTLLVSIFLGIVSILCLLLGWHLVGNIAGAAFGVNMLAGALLKKY